ncbi:MAG TPA: hypothetical protein VF223_13895 [Trebonia sp.]
MAWVSAQHGGFRAARFHRPVVTRPRQWRLEQHRCPAGDRHHRRSLWPHRRAAGSFWRGSPLEQPPPAGDRELGRAFVHLAGAARAAHGPAFDIGARGSAGFRSVADWLAACGSANRGSLHADYEPGFHAAVDRSATIVAVSHEPGFHAAAVYGVTCGASLIHRTVANPDLIVHAIAYGAGIIHGTVANPGAVPAGPELGQTAGALRREMSVTVEV